MNNKTQENTILLKLMKKLIIIVIAIIAVLFLVRKCEFTRSAFQSLTGKVTDFVSNEIEDVKTEILNDYEWVDLGLSVKWATCNVGASSPNDFGNYFAWGETSPKESYEWSNLHYCITDDGVAFEKYNKGAKDGKTRLDLMDDAARVNWGGRWRTPTAAEWDELKEYCEWSFIIEGCKVTSKINGNSIFLPAAGFRENNSFSQVSTGGNYWSSSLDTDSESSSYAKGIDFSSSHLTGSSYSRSFGFSVRPVTD